MTEQQPAPHSLAAHSREASPSQHDAEAIPAGATAIELGLLCDLACRPGPWLILGCGTGRHVRGLRARGYDVYGLDGDERMVAASQANDPDFQHCYSQGLFEDPWPRPDPAVVTLLNHTLTVVHTPSAAAGLFQRARHHLLPSGRLVIDDPGPTLWQQIAGGSLCQGIDGSGEEQCLFPPGDNRFIWRRGPEVDLDSWLPKPNDRHYRLWGMSELATVAQLAGFELAALISYELSDELPRQLAVWQVSERVR
jgi:SAM-dependent methyltransferase